MSGISAWVSKAVVAAAFLFSAASSQGQNTISVGSDTATPGETGIVIPISVTNSQQLTVLNVDVTFNIALCGMITNQTLTAGPHADANDGPQEGGIKCPAEGKISIVFFDLGGGSAIPAGSGVVANWNFDILPGAAGGTFPLTITVVQSSNGPTSVPLTATNGQLIISAPPTNTATQTATATHTATVTRTATFTSTQVVLPGTPTFTPTASMVASNTATASSTATATETATATRTETPVNTSTVTGTATRTNTAAPADPTQTITATTTGTPLSTSTATVTNTPADTNTPANTATVTVTPTVTATRTITNTPFATSTRPAIPMVASPTTPAGLLMISALGAALFFAVRRLGRR